MKSDDSSDNGMIMMFVCVCGFLCMVFLCGWVSVFAIFVYLRPAHKPISIEIIISTGL